MLDVAMYHAPFLWIWQDLAAKDPVSIFNLFGLLPYSVPSFLEVMGLLPCLMGGQHDLIADAFVTWRNWKFGNGKSATNHV